MMQNINMAKMCKHIQYTTPSGNRNLSVSILTGMSPVFGSIVLTLGTHIFQLPESPHHAYVLQKNSAEQLWHCTAIAGPEEIGDCWLSCLSRTAGIRNGCRFWCRGILGWRVKEQFMTKFCSLYTI